MDPNLSVKGPKPISRTRAVLSIPFGGGEGGWGAQTSLNCFTQDLILSVPR